MALLNRFNWIAGIYDRLAAVFFGRQLHDAQLYFLAEIPVRGRVLIVGGGTGKFLEAFIDEKPNCEIAYVEASSAMIELSRKRVSEKKDVKFIHGTEADIPSGELFDVIVTNFFLDVFPPGEGGAVVSKLSQHLKTDGFWIVTDFQHSPKRKHKILLRLMFLFFRVTGSVDSTALWDWNSALMNCGLREKKSMTFVNGFVKASIYQ